MLKIENVELHGWEPGIRGMRNPKNSWKKSDSKFVTTDGDHHDICCKFGPWHGSYVWKEAVIGENDLNLMTTLRDAGTDHRKFMRMIVVYMDVTAPLYWWKEYDTYKVGTVANSCSTMHKIAEKEFTLDDFSCEHLIGIAKDDLHGTTLVLNHFRKLYLQSKDKKYWWQMIQLLPSSYNQRRTIMLNYEVLANIYKSRRNHKLDEWHTFCDLIESLPYSELITGKEEKHD